jgi:hypothetical protein
MHNGGSREGSISMPVIIYDKLINAHTQIYRQHNMVQTESTASAEHCDKPGALSSKQETPENSEVI